MNTYRFFTASLVVAFAGRAADAQGIAYINDVAYLKDRGWIAFSRGDFAAASRYLDRAVVVAPRDADALATRAFTLASARDGRFRDGKRAVELAEKARRIAGDRDRFTLDALAAAYAERGDFRSAVEWQAKANKLSNHIDAIKEGRERLLMYQNKIKYRHY